MMGEVVGVVIIRGCERGGGRAASFEVVVCRCCGELNSGFTGGWFFGWVGVGWVEEAWSGGGEDCGGISGRFHMRCCWFLLPSPASSPPVAALGGGGKSPLLLSYFTRFDGFQSFLRVLDLEDFEGEGLHLVEGL